MSQVPGQYISGEGQYGAGYTIMATKQMIVAICLMVAVLLPEARSGIHKTPNTSRARFAHHRKVEYVPDAKSGVDQKATDPDATLTTVREFHFIMITKEEILAVQLHAFQNSKKSRHESVAYTQDNYSIQ